MLYDTGKKRDFTPKLVIDKEPIEVVEEIKLLGVKITTYLRWNSTLNTFSSKQSLTRHVKTIHDGIVSLKNLFSTPKALSNHKRLFTSVPNLATQGNSAGQVNDPKVVSEGMFICGVCEERFTDEDEMTNHRSDAHDETTAANNSSVLDSNEDDIEEVRDNLNANNDNNV